MNERISFSTELSQETGFTVLLKGPTDIIASEDKVLLNQTGTPYMTKGGTGDVLAGICGALMARGISPFESAACAAFLNGRAGELASEQFGEGMLATDVINSIPRAMWCGKMRTAAVSGKSSR